MTSIASIQKKSRVWMVGIKGAGMAGLAQILKGSGFRVQGSDTKEKFYTDAILKRLRIPFVEKFSPKNVRGADVVIASNAYLQGSASRNQLSGYDEVREARRRKIPVLSYPEALGELFNDAYGIAVAGTHGKSTTAAMIGVMLGKLGANPTALVGAEVLNWNSNARISRRQATGEGGQDFFVIEADEYKNAFLHYRPSMIVLTNIEWDHPDFFPTLAKYAGAFQKFVRSIKPNGVLIVSRDNKIAWRLAQKRKVKIFSFGVHPSSTIRIKDVAVGPSGTTLAVFLKKKYLGMVTLKLWGEHHAHNAAAAIACGMALGFSFSRIKKALASFQGTRRRFEILSKRRTTQNPVPEQARYGAGSTQNDAEQFGVVPRRQGVPRLPAEVASDATKGGGSAIIIDDYAHHPTEIAVTIAAARKAFPGRPVHVLFQPHTFSRTEALFSGFITALRTAERVYILRTYGSAREKKGRVGSEELAQALGCLHFSTHNEAAREIRRTLPHNAIFLALGAGDQWQVAQKLVRVLA